MLKIKSKRQGAELTSILKDGNEMLFDGKTFWNRQSPILFPIVGQIKEGKTQIEGKIYVSTWICKRYGISRNRRKSLYIKI